MSHLLPPVARFLSLLLLVSLILASSTAVYAQNSPSPSPLLETEAQNPVNSGPHFFAGEEVVLTEDLSGDVYVAGNSVRIENSINGDLLVAGAQVTITGTVAQDVRAAGANVDVRGTIGGNLTSAAGTFTLDRQGVIGGSVVSAAGKTDLYGQVLGNTWLRGSVITVGGDLLQNLNVQGERLNLQDEATVAGNLSSLTKEPAEINEAARVSGSRDVRQVQPSDEPAESTENIMRTAALWFVLSLLMSLVGGAVILALFPGLAERTSLVATERPIASLGWGLSHLILTPIVAVLLMVTVIGLPLGLIVLLLYILSLLLGGWVASYALGRKLYQSSRQNYTTQLSQFTLGLVLLQILDLIPVIGWIVKVLAVAMGMGALVIRLKEAVFGGNLSLASKTPALTVLEPLPVMVSAPVKSSRARKTKLQAKTKAARPSLKAAKPAKVSLKSSSKTRTKKITKTTPKPVPKKRATKRRRK